MLRIAKQCLRNISVLARSIFLVFPYLWTMLQAYISTTMRTPFQPIDPTMLHRKSLDHFEQSRRIAILRCIALSFFLGALISCFILLFFHQPIWITRIGNALAICISGGTLLLSYTRRAMLASYVFLSCGFVWIATFVAIDQSGISVRSVLLLSGVALLILVARLLLPPTQTRFVDLVMILLALFEASILPFKGPLPHAIIYPRVWVIVYLGLLYCLTSALSWMAVKTTTSALETYAAAYTHEYELEQQKDQFLRIASHEMRSPLTPLLLSSQRLEISLSKPDLDTQALVTLAHDINRYVRRMDGMIELLLDINRVDQRRFVLDYAICDIAQIMRDVVVTQLPNPRRNITMTGIDTPLLIEGDERRLWQVVSNLVANAIKYTPDNTLIEVSLKALHSGQDHRDWVQIMVRDAGPGIAAENLPHLFDRYYQVKENTLGSDDGWGLGLFLCREIVTAHAGTINVESIPGHGTTFTVMLPCSKRALH